MSVECVLDTNVLIYAVSKDPAEAFKKNCAEKLMRTKRYGLSAQVLQEFFVTVTKQAKRIMSPDEAAGYLEDLSGVPCVSIDHALIRNAIRISQRYQVSYWDAAVIAAAERLNAATVYSEDLNDGQQYGGVRVINPFKN